MYKASKKILYILVVFLAFIMPASAGDNSIPIRVGISDTNFKTYLFENIDFLNVQNLDVMDSATGYIVPMSDNPSSLTITTENNLFRIYVNGALVARNLTGPVLVKAKDGYNVEIAGLKRKGKQAAYRGFIELVRSSKDASKFSIVNVLSLKNYLRGVVQNEMPVRFGLEALKAQTVAARNYAVTPRIKAFQEFDVCDSVACQVYFGANTEDELSDTAIEQTNGIIALDKEYDDWRTEKARKYREKIEGLCRKYKNQATFSYIWDLDNLLEEKDSPFDKGKEVFEYLYKNRIKVR